MDVRDTDHGLLVEQVDEEREQEAVLPVSEETRRGYSRYQVLGIAISMVAGILYLCNQFSMYWLQEFDELYSSSKKPL